MRDHMSVTNIDDKLIGIELVPESVQEEAIKAEPVEKEPITLVNEEKPSSEITTETSEIKEPVNEEPSHDDYGQPIAKKDKVYTESEVQEMMRDRNSRGEFARQEAERIKQEAIREYEANLSAQKQNYNESNETGEDWEQQFESLVEQTLSKREQKIKEGQWQEQAQRQQAEFEIKFNQGASKYSDFEQVVMGKPLTPQMVVATRGMNDPAAFIYAAAKTQSAELGRIAQINDPYVQAVELGKLEERMRKAKVVHSNAPKPIDAVKGDVTDKQVRPKNVDDLLREQEAKIRNGRR